MRGVGLYASLRAPLYLYSLKSAQKNLSSSLTGACATGYVGYILGDRLHTMHKAAAGIHADMRLVSDTPDSPFLDWCALRVTCVVLVLRGARGPDEGHIHNGATPRRDPCLLEL